MIIYATKQTIERYGLPDDLHPEGNVVPIFAGRDVGNPLQEWGAKLFYFEGKKCLQVCNFASKFTLFLFNIKKKDIANLGNLIGYYVVELHKNDPEMLSAVIHMFGAEPTAHFSRLTDRRIISSLNTAQRMFAEDGDYFYRFFEGDVLQTMEINRIFNFEYFLTDKIDGKTKYYVPGERFREMMLEEYGV